MERSRIFEVAAVKKKYTYKCWVGYGGWSFDIIAPNGKEIGVVYSEYMAKKIVRALNESATKTD